MSRAGFATLALSAALSLSGCAAPGTLERADPAPTTSERADAAQYPIDTVDPRAASRFPERLAGFERETVTAYEPGFDNLSASYVFVVGDIAYSATYYRYRTHSEDRDPKRDFELTRDAIAQYHPGTRVTGHELIVLQHAGQLRRVWRAQMAISTMGNPPTGPVHSELWLWHEGTETRKLRVTGPAGHPDSTALKSREFAQAIAFQP